jgi:hypothetical protein
VGDEVARWRGEEDAATVEVEGVRGAASRAGTAGTLNATGPGAGPSLEGAGVSTSTARFLLGEDGVEATRTRLAVGLADLVCVCECERACLIWTGTVRAGPRGKKESGDIASWALLGGWCG